MNEVQYRVVWPPISKPVIALIVAFFLLWLGSLQGAPLHTVATDYLLLTTAGLTERVAGWSLATYALFHADFFGVLFTGIALWLFGGELNTRWSAGRFWGMQVAAVLVGGLACAAGLVLLDSGQVVRGYQAPAMALVFSYCWMHWRSPLHFFFFAMTGRTMLLVFLGFGVVMSAFSGHWPHIVLDFAGVAVGFVFSTRTFHPRDLRTRFRLWRARRKLTVVRSPEDDVKKPKRKTADGQYIN